MDKDLLYIVTGIIAMFIGIAISFLTVIDIIPPLFELLFLAYAISTTGFVIGLYGFFSKMRKRRLENRDIQNELSQ